MKTLAIDIIEGNTPLHQRFAEALRSKIINGHLKAGERLPSSRILSEMNQVHRETVMNGLHLLIQEGWITSLERRGYFVSDPLPSLYFDPQLSPKVDGQPHNWTFETMGGSDEEIVRYNISGVQPDLKEFPYQELRSIYREAISKTRLHLMEYGEKQGQKLLLDQAKDYLSKVRHIQNKELVITNGSQEGAFIAGHLILKKGSAVAVENPGYRPIQKAFRALGASLCPLSVDQEGIDPDDLLRIVKNRKLDLLYLTPLHQYPTTVTLSQERRQRIYSICREYGIPILEDDYDHEFHYEKRPLAPIAANDPDDRVIYLATLSKLMFPSVRIGFVALPKKILGNFLEVKSNISSQSDRLMQYVTARWMADGLFEKHMRRMRRCYDLKRAVVHKSLNEANQRNTQIFHYNIPQGGLSFWIRTPLPVNDLADKCKSLGLIIGKEEKYLLDKKQSSNAFRFAFAKYSEEQLIEIVSILEKAVLMQ